MVFFVSGCNLFEVLWCKMSWQLTQVFLTFAWTWRSVSFFSIKLSKGRQEDSRQSICIWDRFACRSTRKTKKSHALQTSFALNQRLRVELFLQFFWWTKVWLWERLTAPLPFASLSVDTSKSWNIQCWERVYKKTSRHETDSVMCRACWT